LEVTAPRARPSRLLSLDPEALAFAVRKTGETRISTEINQFDPASERDRIADLGVASACRHGGDFAWPLVFVEDPEPPAVLNVLGNPELLAEVVRRIAVVGARRADSYGRWISKEIARTAASSGGVIVSGLALGVDGAAHAGALSAGAQTTVAIVGGGVDRIYPKANSELHREIVEHGCVVSEMPPGCGVWKWSFPARNRLIAAFSELVVVTQAAVGSGSLHTAEAALQRGRPLAAVPGRIDSSISDGANRLIADGAMVICEPADPARFIGLELGGHCTNVPEGLRITWTAVANGEAESLLAAGGSVGAETTRDLVRLELLGLVEREAGGRWRTAVASG
jgi:DNA processing protein